MRDVNFPKITNNVHQINYMSNLMVDTSVKEAIQEMILEYKTS